ncbi:MAG TPA: competence/damage-inducible protein A [Cyclobacteriaceae bacterium]|nr:competence/damage-inducible protein A [Cyclobacteriaceae bacterium]
MKNIHAELITIGDEILYGQTLDTNTQWMSVELGKIGVRIGRRSTIGDEEQEILQLFKEAETRADIILITGGLGPTSDDLTKPCLAKYFNCELKMHAQALEDLTAFFKSRGRELSDLNRQQAALPECCEYIPNEIGTAAGMWFHRNGKTFVSMPGVPHEMKRMMNLHIIPKLKASYAMPVIYHQMVRTVGIPESILAEKIKSWEENLPAHIKLAYLPTLGEVKLRLTATGASLENLKSETEKLSSELMPLIGQFIYGYGEESLENVLGKILRERKLTLATAESCTGGYLAHTITSIPGSSDYFKGSIIAYSNEIKINYLDVKEETLEKYGAVSEETVAQMAAGVRLRLNTDIGIATSGVAGPDGGTEEKPVGTIWIAYADAENVICKKLQLTKERMVNIKFTATAALNLMRLNLVKQLEAKA